MEAISRLVILALCMTALCRLSAATPYERYVRFLGALLLGAQLVSSVLALAGAEPGGIWSRIEEESAREESFFEERGMEEIPEQAEGIRQRLWTQSEDYWSGQLQTAQEEDKKSSEEKARGTGIEPIVIQIEGREEVREGTGCE